ncbi:MAG: FAD dependent oxidoreductase, partial [Anaerolineales bacterium]|nr:FAD dependent oxidoreductase [Anaerolineales bacterium]
MVAFCRGENTPHDVCGKLVVAVTPEQLPRLDELLRRGAANGLQGLRKLDHAEMRQIEPHVGGLAAVHVPEEGIVDYRAVCDRLAQRTQERGARLVTHAKVTRLARRAGSWTATTPAGEFAADFLITCAGLHSDRVATL